jgi:hypothetical protein
VGEGDQRALGEMRATIAREIVRLQAEYYGKGPTKAKTYILDDIVVVVLEESFTRAEKTLAARGERERSSTSAAASSSRWPTTSRAWSSRRPGARSERSCQRPTSTRTSPSRRSCWADDRTYMTSFEGT